MSERIAAQTFHPSVFIKEEMRERGWILRDLVMHMGPHFTERDWMICELSWGMYLSLGPKKPCIELGEKMAQELGTAFDVNPQTFLNLHEAWKQSQAHIGDGAWREG